MFDVDELNRLIKEKGYKSNEAIKEDLNELGLDIGKDAVKKWRSATTTPRTNDISKIALLFDVVEQDLFFDSQKQRERIAKEEIVKDPEKYLQVFKSAYSSIKLDDDLLDLLKKVRDR